MFNIFIQAKVVRANYGHPLKNLLQTHPISLIIQETQHLLHLPSSFWDNLVSLKHYHPQLTLVLAGQPQLLHQAVNHPGFHRLTHRVPPIHPNLFTLPQAKQIIKKIHPQATTKQIRTIYSLANGHFGTLNYLTRLTMKHNLQSTKQFTDQLKDDPLIKQWILQCFASLTPHQQQLITQYLHRQFSSNQLHKHPSLPSLIKLGFFKVHGKSIKFTFNTFSHLILDYTNQPNPRSLSSLTITNDRLSLNGEPAHKHINQTESSLLIAFLTNHNHLLSYDDIANILWPDESSDKFSLYAINQAISRLRATLHRHGFPKTSIKNLRSYGYSLNLPQ